MDITRDTTAKQIADEYAHAMTEQIRKKLAYAIMTYAKLQMIGREIQLLSAIDIPAMEQRKQQLITAHKGVFNVEQGAQVSDTTEAH